MTDRDHFAAAALTGLLFHNYEPPMPVQWWTEQAYAYADAMLRERERTTPKPQPRTAVLSTGDVVVYTPTNHDAAPAARAPADSCVPRRAVDCDSDGTDKADPLTRDCGTGNTPATVAQSAEQPSCERPVAGSTPAGGSDEPAAWAVVYPNNEVAVVAFKRQDAAEVASAGDRIVPLYRRQPPALTVEEMEAVEWAAMRSDADAQMIAGEFYSAAKNMRQRSATLRKLLERLDKQDNT